MYNLKLLFFFPFIKRIMAVGKINFNKFIRYLPVTSENLLGKLVAYLLIICKYSKCVKFLFFISNILLYASNISGVYKNGNLK